MTITGFAGLALLGVGALQPLGIVLLLVVGGYVGIQVLQTSGRNGAARREAEATQAEAEAWRRALPESRVLASPTPLREARALTQRAGGTVYLGVTPDFREWTTAPAEQAVLVLGPPRSGKTTSVVVPTLLVAPGPAVSTSTKLDVLDATAAARSEAGRIWLFDPSGTEALPPGVLELHWSPVHSARTWDGARLMAAAMVDASTASEGVENGRFWAESAKAVLGPALHAAALTGRSVVDVRRWINRMELDEPEGILSAAGAQAAEDDLVAIQQTEERERSSILSTARVVLTAYGSDAAAARSSWQNFDADAFVRSRDTVYITAPSHLQNVLAPLVVGLLEEIRLATYRYARERGTTGAGAPPVLWALDEIANIAPLRTLPSIVSEAGGQGLQIVACFQDLSQAAVRWGKAAEGFLTLFGTKVVFPGIGDHRTLSALSTMVGDWDRPYTVFSVNSNQSTQFGFPLGMSVGQSQGTGYQYSTQREALLSPGEIATIPEGHALMVRSGRWGVLEATPIHRFAAWRRAASAAPDHILPQGAVDDLPALPAAVVQVPPDERRRGRWMRPGA